MPKYSDKNIQSIQGLEWIRLRPEASIISTDQQGLFVLFREAFDNATDEVEQELSPGTSIHIYLFLDRESCKFQIAVRDDGRGIPHGKLVDSYTRMFTSGKYDRGEDAAFKATGGLNGLGSKVIVALSTRVKVVVNRDGKYSSISLRDGDTKTLQHERDISSTNPTTGTLIVFEPDTSIFTEVDKFIESGYNQIVKFCYLISVFSSKAKIYVHLLDEGITDTYWDLPASEAYTYIENKYKSRFNTLVDGSSVETSLDYLKELWNLPSNESFQWELLDISHPLDSTIGFKISFYLPKTLRGTNATTIVNNVPIVDNTSSHIVAISNVIKNKLVNFIENEEYKTYFLSIYKLPLCYTASIKYTEIKFTGLSKTGFRDNKFEVEFSKLLTEELDKLLFEDDWKELYNFIEKDIELKFNIYYNKPLTKSRTSRVTLDIIKPTYIDCKSNDRSECELFIIEGVSASHTANARDPKTQAILMIYGKPKNVLKSAGSSDKTPIQLFENYEAYQILSKVLNINSKQQDLNNAAFSKIILMNDADIDGGHIQALHIGALYTLNPNIITSGMVYIANPPLYEIYFDGRNDSKKKYIQDKYSLIRFFIDCLYRNTFDIYIKDNNVFKEPTLLDKDSYTDFCYIVTELGEIFTHLSGKLAAPPVILEKLTYITPYIQTGRVNGEKLVEYLGGQCTYNKHTDILTIVGKKEDYTFPVEGICEAFYESNLLSYLRKLCWKDLQIYVSTKFTDTLKMTRVSITQLYEMFVSLNQQLKITRQKGLGGMNAKNLKPLCFDKSTRVLHQITSLGDFDRIRSLLSDDATARKEILRRHGLDIDE